MCPYTAVPVVQVDLWTCRYRYQINEHKLASPPQPSTILKYMYLKVVVQVLVWTCRYFLKTLIKYWYHTY